MNASSVRQIAARLVGAVCLIYCSTSPLLGQTPTIPNQVDIDVAAKIKKPTTVPSGAMIRLFISAKAVDPTKVPECDPDPKNLVSFLGDVLLEQDGAVYAQYLEVAATGVANVTFNYTKRGEKNPMAVPISLSVTQVTPPAPPVPPLSPPPVPPAHSKTTRVIEITHDPLGNLILTDAQTRKPVDPVKVGDALHFNAGQVGKSTVDLIGTAVAKRSEQNENGWYMYWADAIGPGLSTIHVTRPPDPAPAGGAATPGAPAATYDATIKVQ